ncbi:MAG: NHL repeat-containing protein [Planctomycetes bacterium]|nr:NHL repeat-containing protein [Planctomycetota bacterium]
MLLGLTLCAPSCFAPLAFGDQLLVAAYASDSIARHDAQSGAWLANFAAAGQDGVLGLALGPDGALYVASELTDSIERFDAASGAHLGAFVFDDLATPQDETGGLDEPSAIVFGPDDHAFVASFALDAIFEYDGRTGAFVRVLVTPNLGQLNGPDAGMTIGPDGNLYVPSFWTNQVKRYSLVDGSYLGNFPLAAGSGLSRPRTVAFGPNGWIYVTSEGNDRVLVFDVTTGAFVKALVIDDPLTPANETGGLDAPTGLTFGPDGKLYVASGNTDSVLRYDAATGAFVDVFVAPGAGGSDFPTFLAFRPDAAVYGPLAPNSFGPGATLVARGSSSLALADLTLELHAAPPGEPALLFQGTAATQKPFGDGYLLVARSPVRRVASGVIGASGRLDFVLDFAAAQGSSLPFVAGATSYFQAWTRDPQGPGGSGFNFSTAAAVTFAP